MTVSSREDLNVKKLGQKKCNMTDMRRKCCKNCLQLQIIEKLQTITSTKLVKEIQCLSAGRPSAIESSLSFTLSAISKVTAPPADNFDYYDDDDDDNRKSLPIM